MSRSATNPKEKARERKEKYKKIKTKLLEEKNKKFTKSIWFNDINKLKTTYLNVLLYLIATSSSIAFLSFLFIRSKQEGFGISDNDVSGDNVSIYGIFYFSVSVVIIHRLFSAIYMFIHVFKYNIIKGLAQLFDLLIFWELYQTHLHHDITRNFLLIIKMKAIIEFAPQSLFICFFMIRSFLRVDIDYDFIDIVIVIICLVSSIISLLFRFIRTDDDVFNKIANKKYPPSMAYIYRCLFRICEITSRLLILSLVGTISGAPTLAFVFCIDVYVNFRLFMYGLIGPSVINTIGYVFSIINLGLVPSPKGFLFPNSTSNDNRHITNVNLHQHQINQLEINRSLTCAISDNPGMDNDVRHILEIAYAQMHNLNSSSISFVASEFLYNIVLQLRCNMFSRLEIIDINPIKYNK